MAHLDFISDMRPHELFSHVLCLSDDLDRCMEDYLDASDEDLAECLYDDLLHTQNLVREALDFISNSGFMDSFISYRTFVSDNNLL